MKRRNLLIITVILVMALMVPAVFAAVANSTAQSASPPAALPAPVSADETFYPNNTVCAIGIGLREEYPELTDKWYHVVPIDLTQDGETVLPLVATNLYFIGEATVTVEDGKVTVTYEYKNGRMVENQPVLNWFTSIDEITTEYLEAPEGKYEYGQAVDIEEDLDNAGLGYLFICNNISYYKAFYKHGGGLPIYRYTNESEAKAREPLFALMANPPVQPTPVPTPEPTSEPTVEPTAEPVVESTEAPAEQPTETPAPGK